VDSLYFSPLPQETTLLNYQVYQEKGEPGTPQPYSVRGDNMLTLLLLLCFVLFAVSLARSGQFIFQQAKDFFLVHHEDDADDQSPYLLFHVFMLVADCLLLGIFSYVFASEYMGIHFIIDSQFMVVMILCALFGLYFMVKWFLYSLVNTVFFSGNKKLQWDYAFLLITAIETVLLFPLVLLIVYFEWSVKIALFFFVFVLIINKMLTFYKSWSIFFRQNNRSLQIFLYFCALELTPLFVFGGAWLSIVNVLKVNF